MIFVFLGTAKQKGESLGVQILKHIGKFTVYNLCSIGKERLCLKINNSF